MAIVPWTKISQEKPPYYKPVILKNGIYEVIAWRAWSEDYGDIYTINETDIIWDKKPIVWKHI